MPLPATIVNINSANWSDHLNSNHKPVQRIRFTGNNAGENALRTLGDSATNEAWGNRNVTSQGRKVVVVMVKMRKVGNPTDGVVCKFYNADGGLPGTLLGTSTEVKASQLSTSANRWVRFWFLQPIDSGAGFVFNVAVFRTGSFDASNHYQIDVETSVSPPLNTEQTRLSSGSWSTDSTAVLLYMLHEAEPEYLSFGLDRTNSKLRCYSTVDGGFTWAEKDAANAPSVLSTANFRSIHVHGFIGSDQTWIAKINSATVAEITSFIGSNGTWSGGSTLSVPAFSTNVSGTAPLFGFRRNFSAGATSDIIVYQGTETVMGNARRRLKLTKNNPSATYDVVGSANTPNSTLPGTAVDYDLRSALMDDLGNVYIFYTQSDDSLLRLRIFKTNDTFCTILNPGSAASSNSAAYPVGLGTTFWRDGENHVALPYVDGSNTKEFHCKAGVDAETAGNWTVATIAASAAETTTSNPATLVPDNEGGGKLFCFRVRADDTIGLSDDGGSGVWLEETNWRSGQVVAGIAGGALLNPKAAGITYLDTAPATDELRHDHL